MQTRRQQEAPQADPPQAAMYSASLPSHAPFHMQTRRQRARVECGSSPLVDLPDALLQHCLMFTAARDLASLAASCHPFAEVHVPEAIPARARMLGHPLPALKPGETVLTALHFVEAIAMRQPCTISADTCHTVCVDHSGGVAFAWGGHEHGPDELDDPLNQHNAAELPCWLSHLGHGRETGLCVRIPTPMHGLGKVVICEVAAGYEHTLLRASNGCVWSCGVGEHGRLGHGHTYR